MTGETPKVEAEYPQWYYDLSDLEKSTGAQSQIKPSELAKLPKPKFMSTKLERRQKRSLKPSAHELRLRVKRAWQIAFEPASGLVMNFMMFYFAGNSTYMMAVMLYMLFIGPLKQAASAWKRFGPLYEPSIKRDIYAAEFVYVLLLLLRASSCIWKVSQLGLLPTHTDWVEWERPAKYIY